MSHIPITNSLADLYRWRVKQSSNDIAFKFLDRETTYKEHDCNANKVAQGLIAEGCKPNTRVAFLAKNSDYYCELLYGSLKSRTVLVGINWRLAAPEVAFILNDSQSEILFVGPEFYDLVEQIEKEIPSLRRIITMEDNHGDWVSYESWRDVQEVQDPMLAGQLDDDMIQLYTSGTTGHPKGVQLTNSNLLEATPMVQQTWGRDWHEGSVNMVCSPVFHVAGSNIAIMGFIFGCKNIIIPEADPGNILKLIETEKIELALMVPALILFVLQHPDSKKTDFSSVRQIVYGASPIAEDTLLKAMEVMQCDFWHVYGLTETSGLGTTMLPEYHDPSLNKLRSCGQVYPGIKVKIVDTDNQELGVGEIGEILIHSASTMKGYWNRPDATAESIVDNWFYTGDAGYLDEDGFLYIHDRVKDMIISGAENIYPAEVENALMGHPEIADAAVVGVPDENWGESVKGFVILEANSTLTEEEIIEYTRDQIAHYKCPKSINFIEEMPRNPSGKILRKDLRAPFWEGKERNVS